MLGRQRTGSVICTSCGVLVGVGDDTCYNCGRRNPGLWGLAPALRSLGHDLGFVPFVIGTCVIVYVLTLVPRAARSEWAAACLVHRAGVAGALPLRRQRRGSGIRVGRWWTVLSAGWLHGGLLHILFNMMAVRQLAPAIADLYGPGRMVIIYTRRVIAGFALELVRRRVLPDVPLLRGGQFTVGASASISGLIGALVYYGHRSGSSMASAARHAMRM